MTTIYTYTRKMALADGVLIDVTETANQAGIIHPTAVTERLYQDYIRVPNEAEWQDEQGRLWDILTMLRLAARECNEQWLFFEVLVDNGHGAVLTKLKAHCGPGDNLEPVVTIMLPFEG